MSAIRDWWRSEPTATRGAFLAIVGLGVALRLAALAQPMRYDEAVTYLYFVGKPWRTAISSYPFPNNHLLYTVLAKLTSMPAHGAPWAIRLPAFVAGVAIIPLTYAVGRVLYTPAAALIGTALVAASTTLTLYTANARGYTLVVAAYLALLLIADRWRTSGGGRGLWVAFGLVCAAGLATIPVMLYPVGAVAAWFTLTIAVEQPARLRPALVSLALAIAGAGMLAALAYAPIITANGLAALTANRFVASSPWPVFFRELFPSLGGALASWADPSPLFLLPLVAGAMGVGAFRSTRITRESVSVLSAALMWSALLLLTNHRAPFARTWLWLVPIVSLVAGAGIEWIAQRVAPSRGLKLVPAFAAGVAVAGVAWGLIIDAEGESRDTGLFRGAEAVAQSLHNTLEPGDRVLAPIPTNAPLQFYLLRSGSDTAVLSTPPGAMRRAILVLNPAAGQSVDWAIAMDMIDTSRFGPIAPAMHARDGDVFVAERRARSP